jgi:ethanolamine utilization protein EutA
VSAFRYEDPGNKEYGIAFRPGTPRTGKAIGERVTVDAENRVFLLGFDVGSTTTSALIAAARVGSNSVTGRMEFESPEVVYRGDPVFTPFADENIDEAALADLIDDWLRESGVALENIFAGGAIVTGLAARRHNASALAELVRRRIGEAVMATADDPQLESWLAFMGSCGTLSRCHGTTPIINLDIGGGTTNAALGAGGNVDRTGCHFIGARHFQFVPGSYRLKAISEFGTALLAGLGIDRQSGEDLDIAERKAVLDYCIAALEAIVAGTTSFFDTPIGRRIEQVAFTHQLGDRPEVTFSGGVGELVYRIAAGESVPGTTHYGDLGIDLARAIVATPSLARSLHSLVPEQRGRATVYGITLHSTEISGTTLHLPRPHTLPLRDVPIMSRLPLDASLEEMERALALARTNPRGACLQFAATAPGQALDAAGVRELGERIATALGTADFPPELPLVLLLEPNAGKALGQYATAWGQLPVNLLVIDEVPVRGAHFVNIGMPRQQVVPVSYYGMHEVNSNSSST